MNPVLQVVPLINGVRLGPTGRSQSPVNRILPVPIPYFLIFPNRPFRLGLGLGLRVRAVKAVFSNRLLEGWASSRCSLLGPFSGEDDVEPGLGVVFLRRTPVRRRHETDSWRPYLDASSAEDVKELGRKE